MASSTEIQINIDVDANTGSGTDAEPEVDFSFYLPLYKATLRGDWDAASSFFDEHPDALKAKIAPTLETALHIAVAKTSSSGLHFVEKLIERMPPDALVLTDSGDQTALATAARFGNVKAAKLLVQMNPDLPLMRDSSNVVPVHRAAEFGHRKMLVYLLEVTRHDVEPSPFVGESGVLIVRYVIFAEFYDLALKLVQQYPALATFDGNITISPLATMAVMPSAFPRGWKLGRWQRFIYYCSPCMRPRPKIKHCQSLQLVKFLCKEAAKMDYKRAESIMRRPLFDAASHGNHEMVEEIVHVFPPALWWSTDDGRCHNIFQTSVLHRRFTVARLFYQTDQPTRWTTSRDRFNNNILHLAGELAPSYQLDYPSPALQMQRELLWFKEVEKSVPPAFKEELNSDMKTPAMVFKEAHKELLIEAEKSMKDTAKSYSLVAALIATVMFAAAITVPGGSNNVTGVPVLITKNAFMIFVAFDAFSLLSSIVSIIMFLSIWTDPCVESDFLYKLPGRLLAGHFTLYFSIAFMMAAFSATLYLFYGHNKAWVLAPVVAYGSIPAILLMLLPRSLFGNANILTCVQIKRGSNRPLY